MRIKSSITYQEPSKNWPTMLVQYFESWQGAFKETQKLINKFVRVRNAKLLNVIIEETE